MDLTNTTPSKTVGVTQSYEYLVPVSPNSKIVCGRTGIDKKYGMLTDADIELMINKGNKNFTKKVKTNKPV